MVVFRGGPDVRGRCHQRVKVVGMTTQTDAGGG